MVMEPFEGKTTRSMHGITRRSGWGRPMPGGTGKREPMLTEERKDGGKSHHEGGHTLQPHVAMGSTDKVRLVLRHCVRQAAKDFLGCTIGYGRGSSTSAEADKMEPASIKESEDDELSHHDGGCSQQPRMALAVTAKLGMVRQPCACTATMITPVTAVKSVRGGYTSAGTGKMEPMLTDRSDGERNHHKNRRGRRGQGRWVRVALAKTGRVELGQQPSARTAARTISGITIRSRRGTTMPIGAAKMVLAMGERTKGYVGQSHHKGGHTLAAMGRTNAVYLVLLHYAC